LIPSWDKRRIAVECARIIGAARGRGVIRIVAFLSVLGGIDQQGKITLDLIFSVFFGKALKVAVGLDRSWQCRDTQADVDTALIVGAREIKVDPRKGGFVDGSANVKRGARLYMLAEGTGITDSREGKEEGRNNGER